MLPGAEITPKGNEKCDKHPDRESIITIVTETDSFGSETVEKCEECYKEYQYRKANPEPDDFYECEGAGCDVCDETVKPHRDPEEGMSGPVYYWCSSCWHEIFKRFNDE